MKQIKERLSSLRNMMKKNRIAAYIIPATDPHASEYIANCWKEREWISGFTGSAGTVVVTQEDAGLWTDSRYFLQADLQLKNTGIQLYKEGIAETPSINKWIVDTLKPNEIVAVNSELFSVKAYMTLRTELEKNDLLLVSNNLINLIWNDRPNLPIEPFFVLGTEYAGMSVADKLELVRKDMSAKGADVALFSALDDIAWLLNIRGTDVDYNPVVVSYVMVEKEHCTFFILPEKLTPETIKHLVSNKVAMADYANAASTLRTINSGNVVMYDSARFNYALYEAIPDSCPRIDAPSVLCLLKAMKNNVELQGIKQAMIDDGVALTHFFMWLEGNVNKSELTECDVITLLRAFRAENLHFKGESFGTIAGYNANGAIVHYTAQEETCATLKPEGILLLDSGAQYVYGTTDITRTVSLGKPTQQQKTDYTLVLKGHIALACAKFPKGTRGAQLDVLARQFLWQNGLHYAHGTGHGVGHYLCVHEGPQGIRMEDNPTVLSSGMVLSNEPGLYRAGQHGIRIENLIVIADAETTEFGSFLKFETLTLYPYDQNLIEWTLLDSKEIDFVNAYHQKVYDMLAPKLNKEAQMWLKEKCQMH